MKTLKPDTQKSLYHSYADLYDKIMNNEIEVDKAEVAGKALDGMNRSIALELKRAEITRQPIRNLERFDFSKMPEIDHAAAGRIEQNAE